jgi:hypothetical protein
VPVDGGGADIFDAAEQRLTAISADDVAEQLAKEANVGLSPDGRLAAHPTSFTQKTNW